ncbi:murein transglycosylase A [Ancylobacter sp. VKM B-3255]|uniref:peptidoglycan lytic exotransglycosylase n=1 Tax=Ancylobacter radicis TaxID=2836179 RepID=A0ABS5R7K9_9HYPH|nr:murein transglycosylase A [Ancylobacter radicis]MBS9477472.1 murein transglycosylase A [Ancylobacter radicis]
MIAVPAVVAGASTAAARTDAPLFLFPQATLEPIAFDALPGWETDPIAPAFTAFRRSCARLRSRGDSVEPPRPMFSALRPVCRRALRLASHPSEHAARAFFQREFTPFLMTGVDQPQGFLTGYYEPEVEGSRTRTDIYATPLYRRPPDLVLEAPPKDGAPANKGKAFRREGDALVPYHDRAAIEDGALAGKGLEVAWIKDPADAFFAHIQGSVRVRLPDGAVLRLNYDGHNGQPYTPIGRLLIEQNLVPREKMSMDAIRAYIADHPQQGRELMRQNRSYIFFREATELKPGDGAIGAQGLPLTAIRSIAIDRTIHVYGTPFFIAADLPTGEDGAVAPFRHLTIAQDTGSAIIGPARADIFFGAGKEAGSIAGRIQHPGRFAIFLPRALDPARHRVPLPKPRPPSAPMTAATP